MAGRRRCNRRQTTNLMACRTRVSKLKAIVAATRADLMALEDAAIAQWEAEQAGNVTTEAVPEPVLEPGETQERPLAASEPGAFVVVDYTDCNGVIQVPRSCMYTPHASC